MGLIKRNKRIIICLVGILLVLGYLSPVNAKSNEEIYQEKLDQLNTDDVVGYYKLGLWCKQNKLLEHAKIQFNKVLELDPEHKKARQDLESIIQSEKDAKIAEIIKKYGPYKGVLDKPGADSEKLPWEKAREKETEHFIVKTNLSLDALNDICFLLECAYFSRQEFFEFIEPDKKTNFYVTKNKTEFDKVYKDLTGKNSNALDKGTTIAKENIINGLPEDSLLTYYYQENKKTTVNTLLHEGTHQIIDDITRTCNLSKNPPAWFNEGMATYFESSRVEGKKLVTGINQYRLPSIMQVIRMGSYVKIKDFINLSLSEYMGYTYSGKFDIYSESWGLVYFLVNGKKGKYKDGFMAYIKAWKENKIVTQSNNTDFWITNKDAHLKLFEECIGVSMDQLETDWKEYILQLK